MIKTNQNGDTIVEVLVALVIATVVLVAGFSITNLSLKQIRMSQERTEAQKTAEGAIESLNLMYALDKTIVNRIGGSVPTQSEFCKADSSYAPELTKPFDSPTPPTTCFSGVSNLFHTAIVSTSPAAKTFKVTVTWEGLNGRNEKVEMYYRVKEPLVI